MYRCWKRSYRLGGSKKTSRGKDFLIILNYSFNLISCAAPEKPRLVAMAPAL
jgi:hypothetical protein